MPPEAQEAANARGQERYERFLTVLLRNLATRDQFLKECSRDIIILREKNRDAELARNAYSDRKDG